MKQYEITVLSPSRYRITGNGLIVDTDDPSILRDFGVKPDEMASLLDQAQALAQVVDSNDTNDTSDNWGDRSSELTIPINPKTDKAL